jgi:hypothetical protein
LFSILYSCIIPRIELLFLRQKDREKKDGYTAVQPDLIFQKISE